jgi:hypothetical protein
LKDGRQSPQVFVDGAGHKKEKKNECEVMDVVVFPSVFFFICERQFQ